VRGEEARVAVLTLLETRAAGATICPSEAARHLAAAHCAEDWRAEMAEVHAAVDRLLADGLVRLSWRGEPLPARDGPYRIARVRRG
jgi:hypothetical protein